MKNFKPEILLAIWGCILLLIGCICFASIFAEEKSVPYLFASIEERMQKQYSPEKAKIHACIVEKITGLRSDQNPLVSIFVNREGEYSVYYVSKICVPGKGDNKTFLWIEPKVIKVSDEEMLRIWKECEGGE